MSVDRRIVFACVLLLAGGAIVLDGLWAAPPQGEEKLPAEIPDEAKRTRNPEEATPQSIAAGKQIYSSQCAMCHGASGDGKGDLAGRLGYRMPDLTRAEVQQSRTDGEWFYVLTHGHGKMSGEGDRLSEKVRWDLVNYLRDLGPKQGS